MEPQTVSELWPSKYIRCDDLVPGRTYELEIARVAFEFLESRYTRTRELRCLVYFRTARKALVLNKTQSQQIAEIAGSERFADWIGVRVGLRAGVARNKRPTIIVVAPAVLNLDAGG